MGLASRIKATTPSNPNGISLLPAAEPIPPEKTITPHNQSSQKNLPQLPDDKIQAQTHIIKDYLTSIVSQNGLDMFYPPSRINELAEQFGREVDFERIQRSWNLEREICFDLVALGLYDIIVFGDDSGSMVGAEGGTRIDDLKVILERTVEISTLFDTDGISLRFMNYDLPGKSGDNIRSPFNIGSLLSTIPFRYTTPLGTELKSKILNPMVRDRLRRGEFVKPCLVIIITDGEPHPEPRWTVREVILEMKRELRASGWPEKSVAYQFAQCGRDMQAQDFLGELDSDPLIGDVIDAVSYYELEEEEFRKKTGQTLSPELYLVKLLIGAINPAYDAQDEAPPPIVVPNRRATVHEPAASPWSSSGSIDNEGNSRRSTVSGGNKRGLFSFFKKKNEREEKS
ncbi:hypothetical protein HDU97_002387 [Phlyctochytrium planicorne]|nr:hypothetical protein HDU97_002387 [Phlyctochytrium planicorne]